MEAELNHRRDLSPRRFSYLVVLLLVTSQLYAAEWQQRADYQMNVALDPGERAVHVTANLQYVNHSPDTLASIWFRLPPEATRGDAPLEEHVIRGVHHRLRSVPEENWGALSVHAMNAADRKVIWVADGSIGRAELMPPLDPGDTLSLAFEFTTKFPAGGAQRRLGYSSGQFKGAYWYPMICPYTPEEGWTVNRYYGTGEAYGEFGDFILNYDVPRGYIVASTGELVNENEVLPPERLEGLSFDNPSPDPIPSIEDDSLREVWRYVAESVPDVAFAMAPDFLIDRKDYGDFEAWAFVRRGRQGGWHDAVDVLGWTIQQLEEIYGPYPWPRVMMTDSWSGMEYPMLTMMSSSSPYYHYFLMHEVIHNYTPMIMHSNSVDNQSIDEGFTTFIEHHLARKYAGSPWDRFSTRTRGILTDTLLLRDDWDRGLRPYFAAVLPGEDLPMVRAGDIAEDYPLLRASSYYKAPVMLNALRYVIGEAAFWSGMRELYIRHSLRHMDERDIIAAFSATANRPLDWFFEPFFYGSGDIEYAADLRSVHRVGDGWEVVCRFTRNGDIRLPLCPVLVLANGDTVRGEISFLPTDKPHPGHARWGSWDQLHEPGDVREFKVQVDGSERPVELHLDPDQLLADRQPLNDSDPGPESSVRWDTGLRPIAPPPMDHYLWRVSPALGHSAFSGWLGGFAVRGSWNDYLRRVHAQVFGASNPTADPVQGRIGVLQPIGRGFGPMQLSLYGGSMHDVAFGEVSVWATWRRWKPDRSRFSGGIHVGGLEVEGSNNSTYLRGDIGSTTRYQGITVLRQLSLATSLRSEGFFSNEATLSVELRGKNWTHVWPGNLLKSYRLQWQARLGWSDGAIPQPLQLGLGSLQPLRLLGSPLAGAPWRSGGVAAPLADGPATMSVQPSGESRRFGVTTLSIGWSPAHRARNVRWTPLKRLAGMTWLSLYGGFAGTHDDPRPGILADVRFHVETGLTLEVLDLWGVSLAARLPVVQGSDLGRDEQHWGTPDRWRDESPWRDITVGIRLKHGLFLTQPLSMREDF